AAVRGELPTGLEDRRLAAHDLFAREVERLLSEAHPLLRRRFTEATEMPYYRVSQARAVEAALAAYTGAGSGASDRPPERLVEKRLVSRDGSIRGRIDLIDVPGRTVYDYKSGAEPEETITAQEARQLRLYAYLCDENGFSVERGVIVRGSGRRDEL